MNTKRFYEDKLLFRCSRVWCWELGRPMATHWRLPVTETWLRRSPLAQAPTRLRLRVLFEYRCSQKIH